MCGLVLKVGGGLDEYPVEFLGRSEDLGYYAEYWQLRRDLCLMPSCHGESQHESAISPQACRGAAQARDHSPLLNQASCVLCIRI